MQLFWFPDSWLLKIVAAALCFHGKLVAIRLTMWAEAHV